MTDQSLPHIGTAFEPPRLWAGIKATLKTWRQPDNDRRYLAQMSPHARRDLFVPTHIIEREIVKPFWRA
jgi:uncharacterized protein YjiS (DUF1127 family)